MADKKKIEEVLGEEPAVNPATATPSGEEGDENPLEKMDQISKAKPGKKDKGSKKLDEDVVAEMFKTGENTDGMFTPDEEKPEDGEPELHEEEDEDAKLKLGKEVKPEGKYENQFKDDMFKHPDEYKVMTPRGEMTVAEAIKAGYNPITKRFDKGHGQENIKKKHLSKLNDADRAALEQFTNPANAQIAPADAAMYGLQPGSPMIRPEDAANPAPGANPMMGGAAPAGLEAALPSGGSNPMGAALPGEEESQAAGGMDLSSLLGGGQ